jgi:hypothetical protein
MPGMAKQDSEEHYPLEEAEQRLRKILRGAFAKPPTPLKAVPTRHGQARKATPPRPQKRSK